MEIPLSGRQAALSRLASEGAEPQRIADSAEAIWLEIDGALAPIIGAQGVSALYKRSVDRVKARYPWMQVAYNGTLKQGHYAVLATALSQQSAGDAASGNAALLQAFYELLASLIGDPLTARLLRPALEDPATGIAVQDMDL